MRKLLRQAGILLGTAASLGAVGFVVFAGHGHADSYATADSHTPPPEVRPVRVYRVGSAAGAERSYTGVVKARFETDLGFRVGGKVISRPVQVGDRMTVGQVIATLDPTDYDLAVKAAEADLAAAKADANYASKEEARIQSIGPSASRAEVDRSRDHRAAADARVDRAGRNLALAKNKLGYCELKAETAGVITALPVEAGQVVAEGQLVAKVARDGELEAVVNLPENRLAESKAAARVTVWGEVRGYPVRLRELSPTADPATRTYQAKFSIPDPGGEVTLGRTVTVHLATPPKSAPVVPLTALCQRDGQPAVWRVDGDRLIAVPVTVETYRDDTAVLSAGVKAGDVIVACGVQKLDAGIRVRPWGDK